MHSIKRFMKELLRQHFLKLRTSHSALEIKKKAV